MNQGQTVFAQLTELLPRRAFENAVQRYEGHHRVRSFSCMDQLLCMIFAQITGRSSLRETVTCLRAIGPRRYHCGIRGPVSRSTLADANEQRDHRIFMDTALAIIAAARLRELTEAGIRSVTALTHPEIFKLVQRKVIAPGLFDEREIAEVRDPASPNVRYLLCRNPLTAEKERRTREALMAKSREALEQLARSRKRRTVEELGAAVGKALARWKVGKFFIWRVREGKLDWEIDRQRLELERSLDGCYVVRTDVSEQIFDRNAAVASYRQLAEVERDFRQLKTVAIEIRPTYHHKDERIEAHVFLCMLAYYIQWHMHQQLAPLFKEEGEGRDRRWTFVGVLERLKGIRQETVVFHNTQVTLKTTPDDEQQQILDLLGVRL